ncbi:MAG: glycosyltransferase [Dehalococcoidia bacterium]|nr:glycosyltransferase [Dehalococcoidia bacterium]
MAATLASIIVNNYNYADFLKEAIDSALAQTYENIEVLVVDDGSTDASRALIAAYGGRIIPIFKENGGQASSFNAGFGASSGEVVVFLDADDVLLPDALLHVVPLFDDRRVAKVHWPLLEIDERGKRTGRFRGDPSLPEGDFRERLIAAGPRIFSTHPTSGNAWSRRFLEEFLPVPEQKFRICADFYLFTMAFAFGEVRSLSDPQAYWRKHDSNHYHATPFLERAADDIDRHNQVCEMLSGWLESRATRVDPEDWRKQNGLYRRLTRLNETARKLSDGIPEGSNFLLVDNGNWELGETAEVLTGREAVSLRRRSRAGRSQAPIRYPGITELEELTSKGIGFIVFAWPAVSAFKEDGQLRDYLHSHYRCVVDDQSDLVVFDLRTSGQRNVVARNGSGLAAQSAPINGRETSTANKGRDHVMEPIRRALQEARQQVLALEDRIEDLSKSFDYLLLRQATRDAARATIPRDSKAAVVSKGDESLLDLGCDARHFPQGDNGAYAGHHPADGAEAIAALEASRDKGAQFLVLPSTAFWWLDHYADFRRHLDERYERIWGDDNTIIYGLEQKEISKLRDAPAAGTNGLDDDLARLASLRELSTGRLKTIADAIAATLDHSVSPAESAWIGRIEHLRRELSESVEEIPVSLSNEAADHKRSPIGEVIQVRSVKPIWGLFLFKLIRGLRPGTCLELGTAVGVSGAYQGAALKLNRRGTLVTVEGAPGVAALASQNFDRLGLNTVSGRTGLFQQILDGVLADLGTVDFAFIDGHHDQHATIGYFRKILDLVPDNGVLVFDDIGWSAGMKKAWETISNAERVRVAINLGRVGICVIGGAEIPRASLAFPHLERFKEARGNR